MITKELSLVTLSRSGAELLFDVFGRQFLSGLLLDRLFHHVRSLEVNGINYRLKLSRENAALETLPGPDNFYQSCFTWAMD